MVSSVIKAARAQSNQMNWYRSLFPFLIWQVVTYITVIQCSPPPQPTVTTVRKLPSSLLFLTHSSFKNDRFFCRIQGVCRTGDGLVFLPKWMKTHAEHIAKCGLRNVTFTLFTTTNSSNPLSGSQWKTTLKGISLNDSYRKFDLFGIDAPAADREALAIQLTPLLHLLDMLRRPLAYSDMVNSICVKEGSNMCNALNVTQDAISVDPLLLVDSRITNTKDFQWPKSLLRLVRSSLSGNFQTVDQREVYSWKLRSKASCFHALLSTNAVLSDMPEDVIAADNAFFIENGLERKSVKRGPDGLAQCTIKVLILNRFGRRYIEGADMLASAITAYGRLVTETARHVAIEPEVVFFENLSFHEQVSIVQEADVIVASHGESNANLMFARRDTQVFEILPFGYISDIYKNLSTVYGSNYHRITSQPDVDVFTACVRHFNPNDSQERTRFLRLWRLHGDTFRNSTIQRGRNIVSSYSVPEYSGDRQDKSTLVRLRECATYQRTSVDIRDLARGVVFESAKLCPIHTDLTFLQF